MSQYLTKFLRTIAIIIPIGILVVIFHTTNNHNKTINNKLTDVDNLIQQLNTCENIIYYSEAMQQSLQVYIKTNDTLWLEKFKEQYANYNKHIAIALRINNSLQLTSSVDSNMLSSINKIYRQTIDHINRHENNEIKKDIQYFLNVTEHQNKLVIEFSIYLDKLLLQMDDDIRNLTERNKKLTSFQTYVAIIVTIIITVLTFYLLALIKVKNRHIEKIKNQNNLLEQNKNELTEQKEQFEVIYDTTPSIMLLLNENTEILNINKSGVVFSGFNKEHIINKQGGDAFECIYSFEKGCGNSQQCDKCVFRNTIKSTFKTGTEVKAQEAQLTVIRNNAPNTLDIQIHTRFAKKYKEKTLLVSIDNITNVKKALKSALVNELQYKELFKNMKNGFVIFQLNNDKHGNPTDLVYKEVNPAFEELIRYKSDTIIGKTVKELFPVTGNYQVKTARFVIHNKIPSEISFYSTEIKKYLEMHSYKTCNNMIATFYYDITDRVEYQNKIIEDEHYYKELNDITVEGIILHKNGIGIDINKAFSDITGYSKEEIIGKNVLHLLTKKDSRQKVMESLSGNTPVNYEIELSKKDNTLIYVEIVSREIIFNNQPLRLAAIRDINLRKRFDQTLTTNSIQAEERERERLARELHDGIGPIFSSVKLLLHAQQKEIPALADNELNNKINQLIEQSINSIKEISNNLSPHVLRNFGLSEAIRNYIDNISNLKNISFDLDMNISARLNNILETTLYRVITELISNSVKHANPMQIGLKIFEEDNDIYINYSDNGSGCDLKAIKKHSKGMGLMNIENRIKNITGDIKFHTKPGQGFKVKIIVPVSINEFSYVN